MLNLNINPTLISLGPFQIRYYGMIYVLGFIISLWALFNAKKKNKIALTEDQIYSIIFYAIIGVLIGARIFHIIFGNPLYYMQRPIEVFYIWQGGLSYHGGLVGAAIAVIGYSKKYKINYARLADILVVPAAFALALGRIANFINQEILGTITQVPWCIRFLRSIDPINCRHPVQLYAAFGRFITFFAIWKMPRPKKDGFIFWSFVTLIAVGRFFLDFIRDDPRLLNLSAGQWLSAIGILISAYALKKWYKEDLRNIIHAFSKKIPNKQTTAQ